MFCELGYGDLVRRARAGARRMELVDLVPEDLLGQVCLAGSKARIAASPGPTTRRAPTAWRWCPPPPRTPVAGPCSPRSPMPGFKTNSEKCGSARFESSMD